MRVLMRQLAPFSYPGTTVCVSVTRKLLAVAEAVYVIGPKFEGDDDDGESDTSSDSGSDADGDADADADADSTTESKTEDNITPGTLSDKIIGKGNEAPEDGEEEIAPPETAQSKGIHKEHGPHLTKHHSRSYIKILHTDTGRCVCSFRQPFLGPVDAMSFCERGMQLVVVGGSNIKTIVVWQGQRSDWITGAMLLSCQHTTNNLVPRSVRTLFAVFTPSCWHQQAADQGHDVSTIFSLMVGSETPVGVRADVEAEYKSTLSLWDYTRQEISPVISDVMDVTPEVNATSRLGPMQVSAPQISPMLRQMCGSVLVRCALCPICCCALCPI